MMRCGRTLGNIDVRVKKIEIMGPSKDGCLSPIARTMLGERKFQEMRKYFDE